MAFMIWIRDIELCRRESIRNLLQVFGFGATVSVLVAATVNDGAAILGASALLVTVVIAPLNEEAVKGLGPWLRTRHPLEPEDGFVYGASAGLGFAAVENVLYFTFAADLCTGVLITTIVLRTLSTMLLHASASAIFGYGLGLRRMGLVRRTGLLRYYLAAVGIHAAFNAIVSVGGIFGGGALLAVGGLLMGVAIAWTAIGWVRGRIERLDRDANIQPPSCQ